MSQSRIAYRAAEIIAERGHCKHELEDSRGRVCLVGAVIAARSELNISLHKPLTLLDTCDTILESRGWPDGVVRFNNNPETSAGDIILLLRETAAALEITGD